MVELTQFYALNDNESLDVNRNRPPRSFYIIPGVSAMDYNDAEFCIFN
jgi:hypothetical protein